MENVLVLGASTLVIVLGLGILFAFFPALPRDLGGVADLDREAARIRIPVSARETVDGWFLPGGTPSVVLLLHGHGRTHARMWRYAHFLRSAGHHVLAIDFRCSAASRRRPTTLGRYEVEDARAAVRWIRSRPELRGCAVGVLGESLGGAIALAVAADDPEIDAVVDDSGFATGALAIRDFFRLVLRLPGWPERTVRAGARILTGCDPGALDVRPAAAALSGRPVLFIHGERDDRISPEQTRALWAAAGSCHDLWVVPGAGHNRAWSVDPGAYEDVVTRFFARHLSGLAGDLAEGRV